MGARRRTRKDLMFRVLQRPRRARALGNKTPFGVTVIMDLVKVISG